MVGKKKAWYEIVPKECAKLANKAGRGKTQFYEFEVNSLSDLPYTVAKIVLYRAYRNPGNIELRQELEQWSARNSQLLLIFCRLCVTRVTLSEFSLYSRLQ